MKDTEVPAALAALLAGMHAGEVDQVAENVADNIVLKSPIFADPFVGREQALAVIGHLLGAVDEFDSGEILIGEACFAVRLTLKVGAVEVEGVDIVTVDEVGKVDSMTIQWRPLPAIVAVQNRLAPAVGVPVLKLTPAD